jgi:hypothetical protein
VPRGLPVLDGIAARGAVEALEVERVVGEEVEALQREFGSPNFFEDDATAAPLADGAGTRMSRYDSRNEGERNAVDPDRRTADRWVGL